MARGNSTTSNTSAGYTPEGSVNVEYPDSPGTSNLGTQELNAQIQDLRTRLAIETDRRERAEEKLAEKTRQAEELEKQLDALKKQPFAAHMAQAYKDMGPGEALIATIAAPLITAPMAVTTVVKGFESVGNGIAYLFSSKKKDVPVVPAAGAGAGAGAGEGAAPK